MDVFLKKLAHRLQREAVEGVEVKFTELRKSESKTINITEIVAGPLYARIIPITDDHRLFNAEVYVHKMTRAKLTHVSPEFLIDSLVVFAKEVHRPNYVEKQKAKSLEPYQRVLADEEEPSDAELDKLIRELDAELNDRGEASQKEDGDKCKEAPKSNKNVVKTFPKDKEKVEAGKTPEKKNVDKQDFKKDGVIKFNESFRGAPVRLNESLKNCVLIYVSGQGAVWVPKEDYQNHLNETKIQPDVDKQGGITFKKLNEEKENNKFIPVNLRGL